MKEKVKRAIPCLLTAAASICACFLLAALLLHPQPLHIGTADLDAAADGSYIGICLNKVLFARSGSQFRISDIFAKIQAEKRIVIGQKIVIIEQKGV